MTMEDAIRSTVAQAMERFAAYVGTPPPAATWSSSSSSATLTNCDINRIHAKAQWLIRMLSWVRASLDDAEDMDITEESVCDWLRELQAVADAAEDVLDELPYEAWRLELVENGDRTAGIITEDAVHETVQATAVERPPRQGGERTWERSLPHQVHSSASATQLHEISAFLSCVEQRLEDIVSRFMKINKPEQALKLDCREEQVHAESISARRTTSSVIEEPRIVGRDQDLAKIMQFLLSSDAEESRASDDMDDHVSVMAIVGMGGLGKTTLAQLAYNDDQVNQHFQLKSWVCVSEDFDVIRLTKAMLQSLNVEACDFSELDLLQRKLVEKLSEAERFLLVLDDVWEADNLNIHSWNLLTAPFRNTTADTKIIMTTRSRIVSEMVPRILTHDLGFLSDEDALELFMLHAFEGRDPNLYQNLVAIGKEIARRCKGVPLAAKTLGGLLLTKGDDEWNKILESEVWSATIYQEGSIIPILRLSYRHLPAPLKRCFRYCSLFPKDYVFDRNRIIRMWMAQGYIKANRRELMEDIGQRYINNLLSRSFFQKYPREPKRLQMHDLMHDLATCVSVDECYGIVGKSSLIPSSIRHVSRMLTIDSRWTVILSIRDIPEPNFFRSFLLRDINIDFSIFELELLSDSYTRMEHLRVLDLSVFGSHRFPDSFARLKHLRYLRIPKRVEEFLEFVGSLHHLQTLDLGQVSDRLYDLETLDFKGLYKLPNSLSNLHNLRHLILSSNDPIEYPVGIGKLADLQTMPGFLVSPEHCHAKLWELKDMNNIRGEFAIKGLENLADVNEAKKACLDKKRNISYLHLERDHEADSSPIDEEVLESLKPSVKLRSLKISGFKGPSYPSWLGDLSFSILHTIKLEHCGNWASLPPLGQLPSLKSLYISEARAVEYIDGGFFSGGFPQLEELTLEGMYNWKSWCGPQEGDCPKLTKLSISSCENLESLSLINLGAVEVLSISECPELRFLSGDSLELSHIQSVQTIRIKGIYQVGCIEAAHFSTAAPLEDQPCLVLESVDQREAEYMLGLCSTIWRLTVTWCLNLTSLPLGNLNALEYVEISVCPQLRITSIYPQLQQLPSLKKIFVHRIHDAERIAVLFEESQLELENVDQLVASFLLKELSHMIHRLTITQCANLTSLPWTDLTTLEYLTISECPLFQFLDAEQLPPTLCQLTVKRCSNLASLPFGFSLLIRRLTITACANLTSLPWTDLTTLEYLTISECPLFQLLDAEQLPPTLCQVTVTSCSNLTSLPFGFSLLIRRLTITACADLTSLPWTDLITLEYLTISECPLFQLLDAEQLPPTLCQLVVTQCENLTSLPLKKLTALEYMRISDCPLFRLLDAEQLPPTLQVSCIYGNPYKSQQCSNKEGGERNLYLVFRNVHDANEALKFCFRNFTEIHTLDIEWDCCTNDWSNVTDAVMEDVLFYLHSLCISSKRLVIQGYRGSAFAGYYEGFFPMVPCIGLLRSRLSYVSLLHCPACDLGPLSGLPFLQELHVKGASNLESVVLDCLFPYDDHMSERERRATHTSIAFPCLQKLEFHDMPVWKEWLGTKEGDFSCLWKLVLEHCPRLRALPHLPPGLKELILEGCQELQSLCSSSQGLKSLKSLWRLSVTNCPNLDFTATEGPPPRLELMSLTGCPLLLAWCERNPRMPASLNYLLVDGVQVSSTGNFTSLE